jgi:hypothetical protein
LSIGLIVLRESATPSMQPMFSAATSISYGLRPNREHFTPRLKRCWWRIAGLFKSYSREGLLAGAVVFFAGAALLFAGAVAFFAGAVAFFAGAAWLSDRSWPQRQPPVTIKARSCYRATLWRDFFRPVGAAMVFLARLQAGA